MGRGVGVGVPIVIVMDKTDSWHEAKFKGALAIGDNEILDQFKEILLKSKGFKHLYPLQSSIVQPRPKKRGKRRKKATEHNGGGNILLQVKGGDSFFLR